jgi:hypothetical protein
MSFEAVDRDHGVGELQWINAAGKVQHQLPLPVSRTFGRGCRGARSGRGADRVERAALARWWFLDEVTAVNGWWSG